MVTEIKQKLNGTALPLYRGLLFTMLATLVAGGIVFYGEMHELRGEVRSFIVHQTDINNDTADRLTWLEHERRN